MTATFTRRVSQTGSPITAQLPLRLKVAQAAVVAIIVLLTTEFLFALAGVGEEEYLKMDKTLGFVPMSGKHLTWRREGFSRTVFNHLGMRNPETTIAKPANTFRIAVLGDSMVEAVQVDQKQTFCQRLEDILNSDAPGNRKIEVLNFGVSAYSLAQMCMQLEHKVLEFQPDLVVVTARIDFTPLIVPNLTSELYSARPCLYSGPGGKLVEDRTVQNIFWKDENGRRMLSTSWLREYSRIWGIIGKMTGNVIVWWRDLPINKIPRDPAVATSSASGKPEKPPVRPTSTFDPQAPLSLNNLPPEFASEEYRLRECIRFYWPLVDAIVNQMATDCRKHNCRTMILRLPNHDGLDDVYENQLLSQTASSAGIPVVWAAQKLRPAILSNPFLQYYIYSHLGAPGHEVVANQLAAAIKTELSKPPCGFQTMTTTLTRRETITGKPRAGRMSFPMLLPQVAIVLVLVVLALEFLFAMAGVGDREYLRLDPKLGFVPMPGKHITWREEGFSRTVFNSFGMRNPDTTVAKPANTVRIAVLGDSMVEALQVDQKETFCQRLQDILNAESHDGRKYEVLNFGVSAYSLSQMYLLLKNEVFQFQPDLTIITARIFFTPVLVPGFMGHLHGSRTCLFVGAGGRLIEDHTVQTNWLRSSEGRRMRMTAWLREYSRIWGVIGTMVTNCILWCQAGGFNWFHAGSQSGPHVQAATVPLPQSKPSAMGAADEYNYHECTRCYWPVADAVLRQMSKDCAQHKSRMMILRLPAADGTDYAYERALLEQTASSISVPIIQVSTRMQKAIAANPTSHYFYISHLGPPGHEIVANELATAIKAQR